MEGLHFVNTVMRSASRIGGFPNQGLFMEISSNTLLTGQAALVKKAVDYSPKKEQGRHT